MTRFKVRPVRRRNHFTTPFDRLFNDFVSYSAPATNKTTTHRPAVNVLEGKEDFTLELYIPGWNKEQVEIKLEKDVLRVEGKRETAKVEGEKFIRREFGYNNFKRSFHLPKTVDQSNIKANFDNGILTVTLSKVEEAKDKGPRSIEIA